MRSGNGLNSSGRKPPPHLIPEQRTDLVSDQPVQNAPCLLRIHLVLIDASWLFERFLNGVFGDFVEKNPVNVSGFAGKLFKQMLTDRLSFAIRVRCEVDVLDIFGRRLSVP